MAYINNMLDPKTTTAFLKALDRWAKGCAYQQQFSRAELQALWIKHGAGFTMPDWNLADAELLAYVYDVRDDLTILTDAKLVQSLDGMANNNLIPAQIPDNFEEGD